MIRWPERRPGASSVPIRSTLPFGGSVIGYGSIVRASAGKAARDGGLVRCCPHLIEPLTTAVQPAGDRIASKWDDPVTREPVFNVPGPVLAILAVLIAVHVALSMLSPDDYSWWVLALAFIPARYSGFADQIPGGSVAEVTSFVTHMAVHADLTHLAFNGLWLLAFGSVLCARMGGLRFIAFSIAGGIAGALLFLLFNPGLAAPVIGASGAVSAMMGGTMRFLFNAIDRGEGYLLRHKPSAIPAVTIGGALRDRRIVLSSIVFLGINLLAIIGFGKFGETGAIAWEAHIGGYLFGLLAFGAFDRSDDHAAQNDLPPSAEFD
jgi:membrane associated rhomboid family serine protease